MGRSIRAPYQGVGIGILAAMLLLSVLASSQSNAQASAQGNPQRGLTFGLSNTSPDPITGTAYFHCTGSQLGQKSCNPYKGDTQCSAALPILCFRDTSAQAPAHLKDTRYWSGGIVATTQAVPASKFKSIAKVNAYCAAQFGTSWRAASFHDGGGWGIKAYGNTGKPRSRVWVDVKDQKDGTCWTR